MGHIAEYLVLDGKELLSYEVRFRHVALKAFASHGLELLKLIECYGPEMKTSANETWHFF